MMVCFTQRNLFQIFTNTISLEQNADDHSKCHITKLHLSSQNQLFGNSQLIVEAENQN